MSAPFKISLGYWLFGSTYVVLGDSLVMAEYPTFELAMLKGVLFVTITAVLLYFLMRRSMEKSNAYQKELSTIVNRTSDLLWMVNAEHRFVLANKMLCEAVRATSAEDLLGRRTAECTTEELYLSIWKHRYDRAFQGETVQFLHEASSPLDNREFHFTLYPVKGKDGQIDRVVCFGHDVTELRQTQKALEKQNEALKEIAWMQSHEVRKPLANIMGLISAIDGDVVDNPELKDILIHIKNQSVELDDVIHKIVAQTTDGVSDNQTKEKLDLDDSLERG